MADQATAVRAIRDVSGMSDAVTAPPRGDTPALVRLAARGDRAAFGELYARFARLVHGVLLAHALPDEVDDLLQEVFLAALERLHTLREPEAFGGWLVVIARNQARMRHRQSARIVPLSDNLPSPRRDPYDAGAVMAAIRSLPDAYREPLTLRLVEGMSGAEIAERTGLTPASVRVNLHRGMKQLREKLGGQYD